MSGGQRQDRSSGRALHRDRDHSRARLRAPPAGDSPRRVAEQHPLVARGRGQDRRLRDRRSGKAQAQAKRFAANHGQVAIHVARAGPRRSADHRVGRVLRRRGDLRAGDRRQVVPRRRGRGHHRQHRGDGDLAGRRGEAGAAGADRRDPRADARARSGEASRRVGRAARAPRAVVREHHRREPARGRRRGSSRSSASRPTASRPTRWTSTC